MKKIFKQKSLIFSLLAVFVISITFSSCNNNKAYDQEIKAADALFKKEQYLQSKTHYSKALTLKKGEAYPKDQIAKINTLLTQIKNEQYNAKIKEADAFFNNKEYKRAKRAYLSASTTKPNENYPKQKINEIDALTAKSTVDKSKPYLVVVGSYAIESNAYAHQKKLNNQGFKSTVVKSVIGNYLVSIKSFNTLTKSYNYLDALEDGDQEEYDPEVWVYKIK